LIELELPFPPSVNTYWRNFNGRMLISKKGREYRKTVADQVLIQKGAKHYAGKIKLTIEAWRPDERKRDLDNLLKAPLDALTHAGVYTDDQLIVDLRIYWANDKGGKLKVKVEEI
jgi:crossover junction endodeoxyribonuclease RusA